MYRLSIPITKDLRLKLEAEAEKQESSMAIIAEKALCQVFLTLTDIKKAKQRKKADREHAKCVREAYKESFERRHGIKPVWAAKENSLVYKLIDQVGRDEALNIAHAYCLYNDPFHVTQKHPFGLLVSQINKVRVELNDPRRMLDGKIMSKQLHVLANSKVDDVAARKAMAQEDFRRKHEQQRESEQPRLESPSRDVQRID